MKPSDFSRRLLEWFAEHGRDLPWRKTRNPYRIWISEIMLQQTQVDRVIDYYHRFLKTFPTVQKLAEATWPQLLEVWRGLGYYRRGRNMLRAAQGIVKEHKGQFPTNVEELEKLPGIGPYTARAIAVFAYEQDVLVLDTNTSRVLSRLYGLTGENLLKRVAEEVASVVPQGESWAFHQGLMDFGSAICTAKDPSCPLCPLQSKCSFVQNPPPPLPKKKNGDSKRLEGSIDVAVGVIHQKGKILITRRTKKQHLSGFWEFPGGKRIDREPWRHCLKREIKEELGIEVAVRPHDWSVDYAYEDRAVHLRFHRCSILKGIPKSKEGQELKWVAPHELSSYTFPPANTAVVTKLARARFVDPQA